MKHARSECPCRSVVVGIGPLARITGGHDMPRIDGEPVGPCKRCGIAVGKQVRNVPGGSPNHYETSPCPNCEDGDEQAKSALTEAEQVLAGLEADLERYERERLEQRRQWVAYHAKRLRASIVALREVAELAFEETDCASDDPRMSGPLLRAYANGGLLLLIDPGYLFTHEEWIAALADEDQEKSLIAAIKRKFEGASGFSIAHNIGGDGIHSWARVGWGGYDAVPKMRMKRRGAKGKRA